ncbi:MAG: hypothetical protein J6R46_08490, partial [Clostridia bacterium]|nr:hypothetical protein [Clostridia bacterium]
MKIKLIICVLVLCISASLASPFVAYANEQTILPSWIYDFTDSTISADMYSGGVNVTCNTIHGSHSTLSVFGGDPQIPLLIPDIYVRNALYLCIEY